MASKNVPERGDARLMRLSAARSDLGPVPSTLSRGLKTQKQTARKGLESLGHLSNFVEWKLRPLLREPFVKPMFEGVGHLSFCQTLNPFTPGLCINLKP